jgi:hypothetical protein
MRPSSHKHHNPRLLTPRPARTRFDRDRLILRNLDQSRGLAELTSEQRMSERTACKNLARLRSAFISASADRWRDHRSKRREFYSQRLHQVVDLMHQLYIHLRIAWLQLVVAGSNWPVAMRRLGLSRQRNLGPITPVQPYH